MAASPGAGSARRLPASFYSVPVRAVVGMLYVISRGSLLAILLLLMLSDGPVNPLRLMRYFGGFCLLPGLAVAAGHRFLKGTVAIDGGTVTLLQRRRRVEIPLESIVAVEPWLVPRPGCGLWLRLRSGSRWSDGVALEDPTELVDALVERGAPAKLAEARESTSLVYSHARAQFGRRDWRKALLKFPVFALVPTVPLFRVHQIIAYGGPFGEYHQYGLGPYLAGFAVYWATLTIYLVLFAAVLRIPLELAAIGSAWSSPGHALAARRYSELLAAGVYYTGVPIAVALRFFPW